MNDAVPLAPGTVVGRYRIDQLLAPASSEGPAYRGRDDATQRRVSILEFLPPALAHRLPDGRVSTIDPAMQPYFAAGIGEVQALAHDFAGFTHPNVLGLLECYAANDTAYLVSELPDGRPIERLVSDGESLSPDEIQEILPSLLAGTDAIHKAGLLHLDICPASIWIRPDGTAALGRAHLIRRTLQVPGHVAKDRTRDAYRAEEYLAPDGRLGPWTDIYALAASICRFVIGHPPPSPAERRRALEAERADPLAGALDAVAGTLSAAFLAALRHALALAPANRPQSISAFRAALGAASQGEIPTLPLREPATVALRKTTAEVARARQVFSSTSSEEAPTRRTEQPAGPVPRRAHTEQRVQSSEAPTVRMGRSAITTGGAAERSARIESNPDATKPLHAFAPTTHTAPPADIAPDERPTVRMPQRTAPPIVAPAPAPPPGDEDKKTTVIYRRGRAEVITAPPGQAPPLPAAAASDAEPTILPARFSVFSPMLMTPGQWLDLAVYIHEPGLDSFVRRDHMAHYEGKPGEAPERRSALRYSLKPGAAITIAPRLPGCRVNPPSATVEFWENFHRLSFRVMAGSPPPDQGDAARSGAIQLFVGPLLVGETRIAYSIGRERARPISNTASLAADTFDAVFPAFAAQDGEIADRFAAVAAQLDNPFLAEILALRAREWDREILKRIEAAERLQLFWSPAASRSPHLEEEWRFALALGREHFIRAFYWRHPAPALPPALDEADVALRHLALAVE